MLLLRVLIISKNPEDGTSDCSHTFAISHNQGRQIQLNLYTLYNTTDYQPSFMHPIDINKDSVLTWA